MDKQYIGYIYKTTIITSKGERYYWGQHIYNNYPNIDPNYIGSSSKIKAWLFKHTGSKSYRRVKDKVKDLIKCEILAWCETHEELNTKEYEIIHEHLGKDYCWNITEGGNISYINGNNLKNLKKTKEHKKAISDALKKYKKTKEHCKHISEAQKGNQYAKGTKRSNETKELLRKINTGKKWPKEVNKKKGRCQKGRKWYHNDIKNVFRFEQPEGFEPGYKVFKKKVVTDDMKKHMSEAQKKVKHKPQTEHQKQVMKEKHSGSGNPAYGRKWWTNGVEQKFQKECPGEGWWNSKLQKRKSSK